MTEMLNRPGLEPDIKVTGAGGAVVLVTECRPLDEATATHRSLVRAEMWATGSRHGLLVTARDTILFQDDHEVASVPTDALIPGMAGFHALPAGAPESRQRYLESLTLEWLADLASDRVNSPDAATPEAAAHRGRIVELIRPLLAGSHVHRRTR